ncbi:hypothetical protein Hypma_012697 [Hypsizygus marmoreus]|uniref:Uncharacterized protein n=1 Tax=Hypsizygus marmoreus TaxID=39966 RepID=A0A369JDX9_HYPMA|nr:hypothetical protein Hypma_012697 [Hypsizygus marmoreus]
MGARTPGTSWVIDQYNSVIDIYTTTDSPTNTTPNDSYECRNTKGDTKADPWPWALENDVERNEEKLSRSEACQRSVELAELSITSSLVAFTMRRRCIVFSNTDPLLSL